MYFIFIAFSVLQVLAGYLCAKVIQFTTKSTLLGLLAMGLAVTPALAIYLGQRVNIRWLVDLVSYVGYLYLGFILYYTIYFALAFVGCKIFKEIDFQRALFLGFPLVTVILLLGYLNAINPRLKKIEIPTDVNAKICFVSDIHVGSINTITLLDKIAKNIEKADPDFVIFGGDTIDMKSIEVYGDDFIKIMKPIASKYKIYAVIGNHELYAGVKDCVDLLRKANIEVLLDKAAVSGDFVIAGRLDFAVPNRKSLKEIISDEKKHLIVADHTPAAIEESAENGALIHLSGHTHGGQMFPLNLVVNSLFKSTGVLDKVRDTYYYITYGAGFWGPPYRIGNRPEVILIEFKKAS